MRALVVSSKYFPEYAGSGYRAHKTYKRLANKFGIEFDVLCSSVSYNNSALYTHEEVNVNRISCKFLALRRLVRRISVFLSYWTELTMTFIFLFRVHKRYDYFHVFGKVNVTSAVVTFAKIFKKPVVVEVVNLTKNPNQSESFIFSRLFGQGYPEKSLIVCISEKLKKVCLAAGYTEKMIWLRDNPIDETRFYIDESKSSRKRVSRFCKDDTVLLHIAKFCPLKNQIFLIEVLRKLPEHYKLILAGPKVSSGTEFERDEKYYQNLIKKIEEYGLEERVEVIVGFIKNPEDYIKASDIFLFPSTKEAFGTPVIEALACAKPCVVSNIPGVFNNRIRDDYNGYISDLIVENWVRDIAKVKEIRQEDLIEYANLISSRSSTAVIDQRYHEEIKKMLSE